MQLAGQSACPKRHCRDRAKRCPGRSPLGGPELSKLRLTRRGIAVDVRFEMTLNQMLLLWPELPDEVAPAWHPRLSDNVIR